MKSDFLKKIIAVTVISTTMGSFMPINAAAIDFYTWQQMNSQSGGYWKQLGDNWYFYGYSGVLQTGWIYDKGQWYYADANGVMQTGVVQISGKIYLFSNSGAMQTGNAIINGQHFTFDQNGVATGSNVPTPAKAYGTSGEATLVYTPDQVTKDDDSTPSSPNTVARDPQNLIKYNVKFKDDDGDELKTSSVEKDDKITLYTPTKTGYKFVEWNTKEDGSGKSYDAGDSLTVKNNTTIYAQWKVSTDSNGSNGNGNTSTEKILVSDISVTSTSSSILSKGGTLQMGATVLPVDATNGAVTWTVQNGTGSATISSSGLLTASGNGDVIVVATASDGSNISGKYSVTISGQSDSGTTTGGTTGGSTNTGGSTGGIITAFDQNVKLDDVTINTAGNIVDLPILKTSGKLPTKAKVTCSLSNGTVQQIEIPIADWAEASAKPFNGTAADTYILTATLGDLPTGYTKANTVNFTKPITVNVIVQTKQEDVRKTITGSVAINEITLDLNKHIMNTTLLNSSGILPKTVTLNYADGTVVANVKSWTSTSTIDGSTGIKNLQASIEVPTGYILPSTVLINTTLNVTTVQTATIQEIVEVVKNADIVADADKLKLDYIQNDKLDLSNLKVKVLYNNSTTPAIISYKDFADNNITVASEYFDGRPLTSITSFSIPVTFNGKTVYSEKVTVSTAASPTLTANGTTIYDATAGATTNSDIKFNYTLGTGTKATSKVNSVNLAGATPTWTNGNQYTIDESAKIITVSQGALGTYYTNVAKKTPSTYVLNVDFLSVDGKTVIKPSINPNISFISKPTISSAIALEGNVDNIIAKDNTIKVSGLTANTAYEYCVIDTASGSLSDSNWTSAKSFTTTKTDIELTDTNFKVGTTEKPVVFWIRIKSTKDGLGAVNPASDPVGIPITAVGKTKGSSKSITKFTVVAEDGNTYEGTITEGSLEGTIKLVLPIGGNADSPRKMSATLTPSITLSDPIKANTDGPFTDFSSPVVYTVTAEDKTTRKYTVTVIRTEPQVTAVRSDNFPYTVTEQQTVNGVTTNVTVTKQFNMLNDGYEKALIGIDPMTEGLIKITPPSSVTADQALVLDQIRSFTPYSTNAQVVCVGVKFIPSTTASLGATSVKIADTLGELKTATAVSINSTNMIEGKYSEQVPVLIYSSGVWSKLSKENSIRYYQWIDSNGNIIGYTTLKITVV